MGGGGGMKSYIKQTEAKEKGKTEVKQKKKTLM